LFYRTHLSPRRRLNSVAPVPRRDFHAVHTIYIFMLLRPGPSPTRLKGKWGIRALPTLLVGFFGVPAKLMLRVQDVQPDYPRFAGCGTQTSTRWSTGAIRRGPAREATGWERGANAGRKLYL